MVATSHMWLEWLRYWIFKNLILININLSNHLWLVATELYNTSDDIKTMRLDNIT